ncbi:MAG: hypothetical protein AB1696_11770 [Planctomycetota bacterium]
MIEDQEKREKKARLRREIQELIRQIQEEAKAFFMRNDLPPELAMQFLQEVLGDDALPRAAVRDLFDFDLDPPHPDDLDDDALLLELDKLIGLLAAKRIHIALNKDVPPRLVYQYILNEVLDAEVELIHEGRHVFDGCGGGCEECFQLKYCITAREERPELFEDEPD